MTPLNELRALYARESPHRRVEWDILGFIEHGFFFATPTYILMGKPVDRTAAETLIADPFYHFDPARWVIDTWYIYNYAGSKEDAFRCAFEALPHKLQFLAFHKRGTIRFFEFSKFQARCARKIPFALPS